MSSRITDRYAHRLHLKLAVDLVLQWRAVDCQASSCSSAFAGGKDCVSVLLWILGCTQHANWAVETFQMAMDETDSVVLPG